jgi:cytochrome c5
MKRWSLLAGMVAALVCGSAFAQKYKLVSVPEPDKKIERVWKAKCSSCHAMDATGSTEKGKKMKVADYTVAAWQTTRDDAQLRKAIVEGYQGEKDGVKQEMDGYPELKPDQVEALIQYIRWTGAPK